MRTYAIDCETTGLDYTLHSLLGVGYYTETDGKTENGFLASRADILAWFHSLPPDTRLITQNGKFDQQFIYDATGVWVRLWFDTLLAASNVRNPPVSKSLDSLCLHYLGVPSWKEQEIVKNTVNTPIDIIKDYCLLDCQYTFQLARVLYKELNDIGAIPFFLDLLMPTLNLVSEVEYGGVKIDRNKLQNLLIYTEAELKKAKQEAHEQFGDIFQERVERTGKIFNFRSAPDLDWLFNTKLKIPLLDFKGKFSTQKEVLQRNEHKHPIISSLRAIRTHSTDLTNFKKWMAESEKDGFIHTHYNLDVARTGRLTSSEPLNLQNIKRGKVREVFIAS